jgi:hypothetical protein
LWGKQRVVIDDERRPLPGNPRNAARTRSRRVRVTYKVNLGYVCAMPRDGALTLVGDVR